MFYLIEILPDNLDLFEESVHSEALAVVAQPGYTSRLRYRSDYENNINRRGVLVSVNNTNYQSPAIRVNLFSVILCNKQIMFFFVF